MAEHNEVELKNLSSKIDQNEQPAVSNKTKYSQIGSAKNADVSVVIQSDDSDEIDTEISNLEDQGEMDTDEEEKDE